MFYRCEFFSRVVRYLKAMTELTSLPCPHFLYSSSLLVRYSAGNVYFSHTGRMLSPPSRKCPSSGALQLGPRKKQYVMLSFELLIVNLLYTW